MKSQFKIISDDRGSLLPIDLEKLPFVPKRMFVVDKVPKNSVRGAHAHRDCQQILVCTSGRIDVELTSANGTKTTHSLTSGEYLFHDKMEWAELTFVESESRLLSICSKQYEEKDYIRNWNEWAELTKIGASI